MQQIKQKISKILLYFLIPIFTSLPINNFTNRLIDKLVVLSEK